MRLVRPLCIAVMIFSWPVLAGGVTFGPHDVETVFAIGKSDDGNQFQYALRLEADCTISTREPVFGYWREYDKGPNKLVQMGWLDGFGYGIDKQKVNADKTGLTMSIKTAATRVIEIIAKRVGERCEATAYTPINGKRAQLKLIFVQLSGPLSVSSVAIRGVDAATGEALVERVMQ